MESIYIYLDHFKLKYIMLNGYTRHPHIFVCIEKVLIYMFIFEDLE